MRYTVGHGAAGRRERTRRAAPAVLVVPGEFGWGSLGKLSLILAELGDTPVVGLESFPVTPVVSVERRVRLSDLRTERAERRVGAALVIGEPGAVAPLQRAGLPVCFVDSLPYLWTVHDEVARGADAYLAQQAALIFEPAWPVLREIPALHWIEAIVPARCPAGSAGSARSRVPTALINVGGLHSDYSGDAADAYVHAVVPAVVRGVEAAGFTIAGVCGNLRPEDTALVRRSSTGHPPVVGPLSYERFGRLLNDVDLVVTSPGSTTLLQAHHARKPVITLPPQNVSQVLNTRLFCLGDERACAVPWSPDVFDERELAAARGAGEEAAVAVMYDVSRRARFSASSRRSIEERTRTLALGWTRIDVARPHVDLLGDRGARQVARHLRRLLGAAR